MGSDLLTVTRTSRETGKKDYVSFDIAVIKLCDYPEDKEQVQKALLSNQQLSTCSFIYQIEKEI